MFVACGTEHHVMGPSPTRLPCHIEDGGNSTCHGVGFILDNRGIDADSISLGVSGLVVDNHCFSADSISLGVGGLVNNHIDM